MPIFTFKPTDHQKTKNWTVTSGGSLSKGVHNHRKGFSSDRTQNRKLMYLYHKRITKNYIYTHLLLENKLTYFSSLRDKSKGSREIQSDRCVINTWVWEKKQQHMSLVLLNEKRELWINILTNNNHFWAGQEQGLLSLWATKERKRQTLQSRNRSWETHIFLLETKEHLYCPRMVGKKGKGLRWNNRVEKWPTKRKKTIDTKT